MPNERRTTVTGQEEKVTVLETTIDDMNPEIYSYLFDKLMKDGALDAYVIPAYMKKNRPANLLCVICHAEKLETLLETVFRETSTLGVRIREEKRRVLYRSFEPVNTPWGEVTVKTGFAGEDKKEILQIAPEYEECRSLSEKSGIPLKKVYTAALLAFEKLKK
ncbi:nickel insertion protein [Pelotomaculum propionicicum]|uniref:nickel insertion protein n=1 Tax=Pelotomaculum propionicicum TaxID=258475 RepID=UPI0031F397A0